VRRAPLRFALQAAFLVAVGVALAAAGVELLPFVVVMAVAWVLVATAERMLSRPRMAPSSLGQAALRRDEPLPLHQSRPPVPDSRPVEPEPTPDEQPEPEPQLEAVAASEPEPEPHEEQEPAELVPQLPQAARRRPEGWNLWDLELRANERSGEDQLRDEEWHALFVSLREYAHPDGTLPSEFDALVQDSFAELISRRS
jgi:hypothetical protein